jgi:hypothetical protein
MGHLKIRGSKMMTISKFHAENSQLLRAMVQNAIAREINLCNPGLRKTTKSQVSNLTPSTTPTCWVC